MSPARDVVLGDAVNWLRDLAEAGAYGAVVFSPPDPDTMGMEVPDWKVWFAEATLAALDATGRKYPLVLSVADRKAGGRWIPKDALVVQAAWETGWADVLWHKIVLRRKVGHVNIWRPGYDHLLAVGGPGCRPGKATPDVIERGPALWFRGIGLNVATVTVRFIMETAPGARVLNPFCGMGTMLAVANDYGLDAAGCDNDPGMAEASRTAVSPREPYRPGDASRASVEAMAHNARAQEEEQ